MKFSMLESVVGEVTCEIDRKKKQVSLDVWGKDWAFSDKIINELNWYWNETILNPNEKPKMSRVHLNSSFGQVPNVISAGFLNEKDMEGFVTKAKELIQDKKSFMNIAELRKEYDRKKKEREKERADVAERAKKEAKKILYSKK